MRESQLSNPGVRARADRGRCVANLTSLTENGKVVTRFYAFACSRRMAIAASTDMRRGEPTISNLVDAPCGARIVARRFLGDDRHGLPSSDSRTISTFVTPFQVESFDFSVSGCAWRWESVA